MLHGVALGGPEGHSRTSQSDPVPLLTDSLKNSVGESRAHALIGFLCVPVGDNRSHHQLLAAVGGGTSSRAGWITFPPLMESRESRGREVRSSLCPAGINSGRARRQMGRNKKRTVAPRSLAAGLIHHF